MPEWLAALAPDVAAEVADDETTDAVDLEEMPDWLAELEAPTKAAVEEAEAEVEPELAEADEVPEWLAALAPDVAAEVADDETTDAVDLEEMPDWLAEPEGATGADVEAAGAEVERELADADGIPEWLAALAPDIAETVDEETADEVDLEETPDWLAELEAPTETEVEESVEVEPEFAEADEVPGWPADLAPDAAGEAVEDVVADQEGLTGEDAIAWLERLTADYGDEEHAPTDETAQAVGDFEDVEPLDVAGQTSADLEEEEEAAGELLSGDDALAWLESLTVGKEEELRAEAEQASAARVDEILGRKRDAPTAKTEVVEVEPEVEVASEPEVMLVDQGEGVTEPVVPELEDEVSPEVAEVLQAEAEEGSSDQDTGTAEAVEPPSGEGELLSGDDALAWLESLTIGKEEELRAEAEQASADRVAEILGRPRPAATVETEATKAGPEAEGEMTPEPEISLEDQGEAAAETAVLQLEDEASPDVAEHEELEVPTPEAPALDEAPLEPPTDEIEAVAAEDALSWLENLSPEEAAELREQVDGGDAATVIETTPDGERFFGWSAFDGGPEEVTPQRDAPGPDVSAEVSEPDEAIDHERPIPVEAVEILEADIVEPLEADQASEIAEATGADQMAEGEPEEVAPEPLSAPEPEAEPEPAQEAPSEPEVPSELRPEATPSEATESDLDALRAHVKQKRSDHSARLRLGRELWDSGEIQESMQHYARLIKSSAKTDDVMADLQRYADERPNVPAVLRTLGDAYMKFGELDKALEIFNRAMDQL